MQIHELNQKLRQINEVDVVGPNSVFNVGKQLLKHPAALGSSSALGAAKQAATQSAASGSAATLAKQGYTVGGSAKPTVTTAQQLQAVKANAAVQQQIKTLVSQWLKQSVQLRKAKPVSEAVAQFNPRDLTDPKFASVLKAIQARDAADTAAKKPALSGPPGKSMPIQPYQVPGVGTSATPAAAQGYKTPASDVADKNIELEKDLTTWKEQFHQWSDQKLASQGVTMDMVRQDRVTNDALNKAMTNVAVAAQSGNTNLETEAVEHYLNLAIAGIQAYVNNAQNVSGGDTRTSVAPAEPGEEQQIKQQLDKIGITKAQLEALGAVMTQANRGKTAVNNTGNPVLNAIAQMAGMKVQ